jgi:endonuclease G
MKAPDYIDSAARGRVERAKAQVDRSINAIQQRRPLDAEPDDDRKVSRIARVTGMSVSQAKKVANYESPAALDVPVVERRRAEAIQGLTTDFVPVVFLELARKAANAVGRVVDGSLRAQGSGFLISDKLFLTNNHVIPDKATAAQSFVEFLYELDIMTRPRVLTRYTLRPDLFFVTKPEDELDFTVVAMGMPRDGSATLESLGACPLLARDDKHVLGEFVNIVQHPDGDFKQIVLRENRLLNRDPTVLHYMADTNPGSSGSPVFNDQWEVVALHHWGEPFLVQVDPLGEPLNREMNEGVRISAIVQQLANELPRLDDGQRALLQAALDVHESVHELGPIAVVPPRTDNDASTTAATETRPMPAIRDPNDGMTWTVPLEVTVRVGVPQPASRVGVVGIAPIAAQPIRTAEKIEIDPKYSNRRGYNANFLSTKVPLPKLSDAQRAIAARKKNVNAGEDPFELKYQHFSVVVNKARRMAFFTAVNINGATWIDIDRDTGLPKESAEASEKWFEDPRLEDEDQSHQDLYDDQKPKRLFDRGHLVRRLDPTWGSDAKAVKANADTFHFTNCTPQASTFNSSRSYWQGLEQWLLEENAVADEEKVTVFCGPVFRDNDKKYRYVKVPREFWKIVFFVNNGKPRATAVLASQSKWLNSLPESLRADGSEALDALPAKLEEFQSSVAEIEQLTGLDFGQARDWDTNGGGESLGGVGSGGGPEAYARRRKPLTSFDDIKIG